MTQTRWWFALGLAFLVAGWVVPDLATQDRTGGPETDPIAKAELYLGQLVRHLLAVGYDVERLGPAGEGCAATGQYRVTARSWWFIPITTYEVGCAARVVSGL